MAYIYTFNAIWQYGLIPAIGRVVYTTTVTRPTPEQARQLNCLANQLSKQVESVDSTGGNVESCGSTASYTYEGTDAAEGSFSLVKGGSPVQANPAVTCAARQQLEIEMHTLVYGWVNEAILRAKGKPRSP